MEQHERNAAKKDKVETVGGEGLNGPVYKPDEHPQNHWGHHEPAEPFSGASSHHSPRLQPVGHATQHRASQWAKEADQFEGLPRPLVSVVHVVITITEKCFFLPITYTFTYNKPSQMNTFK